MTNDRSHSRALLVFGAAASSGAALAAVFLAATKGAWLAAALAPLPVLIGAALVLHIVRAGENCRRELIAARREAELLRARRGEEAESAKALGRELAASAARSASIMHRLEGLASGAADGIAVLDQSLGKAVEAQKTTVSEHGRVEESLVTYSREVAAESTEVESMVRSLDRLAESSRARGEAVRALLARAEGAEEKLLSIKKAVDRMVETAKHTADMNTIISDLSERTSILAINASIEAAHAGAAGRGFAIVAGQVRSLSAESQKNSQAIDQAIAETRKAIDETSGAAGAATGYFREVAAEIKKLAETFETFLAEMQALAEGSAKLLGSVERVAGLNEGTGAALRSSAASMDSSKGSLGIVRDIAATLRSDATSMLSAFKESLAEADTARALGERASLELVEDLAQAGAATKRA